MTFDDESHLQRLALLGELSASVFHQVNGPLTLVLGNLSLLEEAVDGTDAREALRDARDAARMIRDLALDVMTLARRSPTHDRVVDLRSCVRAALRITRARVAAAATVVEDLGTAPRVRGDATLLLQVFVNGLVNAADACEASSGRAHTIRLAVGVVRGDAVVSIADDGVGLAAEHVTRVFDSFFTTKDAGRGTGLGLAFAKRIVERVGGRITFDSIEGVGSTLRIFLPVINDEESLLR